MKKHVWILSFLYSFYLNAQTPAVRSFEVISDGSVQNITEYTRALEHSFLDRYRADDHRSVMHFHEGVIVELLSAKELQTLGVPVNTDVLGTAPTQGVEFTLMPPGRIIKYMPRSAPPKIATPPKANPHVKSTQQVVKARTNSNQ